MCLPGWPILRLHRAGWPADAPLATITPLRGQLCIAEPCRHAQALGISRGQPLAQARALCPTLATAPADPEADHLALAALAAWCERWSPLAAPDPPEGLVIDLTGCAHLFGGEAALQERITTRLGSGFATGSIAIRTAIAPTKAAAWALARAPGPSRLCPTEADILPVTADLPLALLRLPERVIALLHRVGLRSIGALARQPRADIAARFGIQPGLRLDQLTGAAPEAITWPRPPPDWREHQAFADPIATACDLARGIALLATRLCARLEASGLGGLGFHAHFLRVDAERPQISIVLARPSHAPARITALLTAKLDQIDPGFGVESLWLTADPTGPAPSTQTSTESEAPSPLPALLDDLANRLTPDRLWRPAPQASHIPERASITMPPADPGIDFPLPPGPRPLRLLRPPEKITATAPIPDDPPMQFRWRGALHRVRHATGPERIAAEWWRRSAQAPGFRDYYQVEDSAGARFWLFRTGLPGGDGESAWYLHGLFG